MPACWCASVPLLPPLLVRLGPASSSVSESSSERESLARIVAFGPLLFRLRITARRMLVRFGTASSAVNLSEPEHRSLGESF